MSYSTAFHLTPMNLSFGAKSLRNFFVQLNKLSAYSRHWWTQDQNFKVFTVAQRFDQILGKWLMANEVNDKIGFWKRKVSEKSN